ncbi:sugar ABC transporter permease [Paenibacillus filicis]|uniref:Sugar ABC transporter permease n=1 Tax=Paenibacillus gyeongsangnamensis TaxID=3388067 RepID=A0ABT4Q4F7_9BACL|nr:sugar ABC transporter permease [Paenibacillus filicis]MCZ8511726.1 sugar ABC transporter permease [Paenibacillus filicis]
MAWILVAPVLIIRLLTSLYPMIMTVVYSLLDYNLIHQTKEFVGLNNFKQMLSDFSLHTTLSFTFIFTLISIILHIVIGVALGLLLNVQFRGKKFLRSIVLIPWALPVIVAGIASTWMFNKDYGMVNDLLFRLVGIKLDWLVAPFSARIAVILTDVWKSAPFFSILILSGLQSIEHEVYESARIDGASKWKTFWYITIPHILRLIVVLTIFFSLWRLTTFELIYAMTQGGPGNATSLLSYIIYTETFKNLNLGYASSISVVLCLFMVIIALLGYTVIKRLRY